MKNIAVILAGGVGQRLGSELPKQFIKIAGKMVIEHTLDVFQKNIQIDEIAVVAHPSYLSLIEEICTKNSYTKIKKILSGGEERYQSSLAAINAYNEEVNLIFHDAVRPLVNDRIIFDCVKALNWYKAVDVAIKATDTIIKVDSKMLISCMPPRESLCNGQTPQAFKRSVIDQAYSIALKDPNFKTTDDCGVVHKYLPDEPIFVVDGELFNMKLTFQEDVFLIDKLFQLRSLRVPLDDQANEFLCALEQKVCVVFGGSYGIGAELVTLCTQYHAKVYSFSRSTGVDVSNHATVAAVLQQVFEAEGGIDFVFNTAGILKKEPLVHMNYEDIIQCINVNYVGSAIVAKESFPYLRKSKGGMILFTSSSYTRGRSMYSIYSSSKAAIVNLVQALSEEWHAFDVRINCINPERTKTPMRLCNFGIEPDQSLLKPEVVAQECLRVALSSMTGEVFDVKNC